MDASLLKLIHVTCAALSYSLFFLRGLWHLRRSPVLQQRWVRIAPHGIDTALLASAILLAWQLGYSPFNSPWLLAKILALLVYIGLGTMAFRFARTHAMQLTFWLLAQLAFAYIVLAAITHNPLITF